MKHRKMIRRTLALILSLATLFIFSPFALAATTEAAQAATYDALPDDAIVCYMYGQPVYKYEVDENGYVNKDFSMNTSARASATTSTLSAYHQREFIRAGCTLVTIGFSQTENIYYMTLSEQITVANIIETCSTVVDMATEVAATYTGPAGSSLARVIKVMTLVTLNDIQTDLSNLANANKLAQLCVTTSQYGQFVNISEWNGTSCVRSGYSNGTTTYTVNSVVCEKHGVSVWG